MLPHKLIVSAYLELEWQGAPIYGIDIQSDNVEESRQRLFDMFIAAFPSACLGEILAAELILERNIVCGDSLKIMAKLAEGCEWGEWGEEYDAR